MSVHGLILCQPETASLKVAALTLLDRLIINLHRAGCHPIQVVSPSPISGLRRCAELNIPFERIDSPPLIAHRTLLSTTGILTHASDVKRVIQARGRLVSPDGQPLPLGLVVENGDFARLLENLPAVTAEKAAAAVSDSRTARLAEKRLWDSLTSASDGIVDRFFNRPVGRPISRYLAGTAVTPNTISIVATLLGLGAAWCFATGSWAHALIGALILQLSAVVDCVDGDIARVVYKESPLGRWLDLGGDQVVHMAVFIGLALGLGNAGSSAPVFALGASAALGVVISFAVVVRGLRQPPELRNSRLQKLIDATANRDFSVLLLLLVFVDRLDLFLWMTAFGVHLFWIMALAVQLLMHTPRSRLGISREERP